ncbi:MAG: hypothetical protein ACYDC3_15110 [Candidatus Binataceae bacterium]
MGLAQSVDYAYIWRCLEGPQRFGDVLIFVARSLAQIAELAWQHSQPVPEVLPALTINEKSLAPLVDCIHL